MKTKEEEEKIREVVFKKILSFFKEMLFFDVCNFLLPAD
jgi:hypothetical protein